MINKDDKILLKKLQVDNPEAYDYISKLENTYRTNISKASHDIKNLLSVLGSSFQFIEQQHPETQDFQLWNQMKDSINLLIGFMDDTTTLRYSETVNMSEINILNLLWNIPDYMDDLYENSQKYITRNFDYNIDEPIPLIDGDYEKLKIALLEIVKNAFEATDEDSTIEIIASADSENLTISVKDCGDGISDSFLPEACIPFSTTKSNHTGVGLAIVQEIVNSHNGHLSIASSCEGTCVSITLPLKSN